MSVNHVKPGQGFDPNNKVRLRIAREPGPGEYVNDMDNPDGRGGAWGYVTPTPLTYLTAGVDRLRFTTNLPPEYWNDSSVPYRTVYLASHMIRLTGRAYVNAGVTVAATTAPYYRMILEFFDASQTPIGRTGDYSTLSGTGERVAVARIEPGAVYVRLVLALYEDRSTMPNVGRWLEFQAARLVQSDEPLVTTRENLLGDNADMHLEGLGSGYHDYRRNYTTPVISVSSSMVTVSNPGLGSRALRLRNFNTGGTPGAATTTEAMGWTYVPDRVVVVDAPGAESGTWRDGKWFPFHPGDVVTFSAYGRTENNSGTGRGVTLVWTWHGANGNPLTVEGVAYSLGTLSSTWQRFTRTLTVPAGARGFSFVVYGGYYNSGSSTRNLKMEETHLWAGPQLEFGATATDLRMGQVITDGIVPYPPPLFDSVLLDVAEVETVRPMLDTGTLALTSPRDALDPLTNSTMTPGREVVLEASPTPGAWTRLFTGTVAQVAASYDPTRRGDRATVTLSAVDAVSTLASIAAPNGVDQIEHLPTVLETAGRPWNCNGVTDQVVGTITTTPDDKASALTQVARTRDVDSALAWVDGAGIIQVHPRDTWTGSAWVDPMTGAGWQPQSGLTYSPAGDGMALNWDGESGLGGSGYLNVEFLGAAAAPGARFGATVTITPGATPVRVGVLGGDSVAIPPGQVPVTVTIAHVATPGVAFWVQVRPDGPAAPWESSVVHSIDVARLIDEEVFSPNIRADYDTATLVNSVSVVTKDRYGVEVTRGPWTDQASARKFGTYHDTYTIQGPATSSPQAFANQILAANAWPAMLVQAVDIPIKAKTLNYVDVAVADLVRLKSDALGINVLARVSEVKHVIEPGGWVMSLKFTGASRAERPAAAPALPVKAAAPEPQTSAWEAVSTWGTTEGKITGTWTRTPETSLSQLAQNLSYSNGRFTFTRPGTYVIAVAVPWQAFPAGSGRLLARTLVNANGWQRYENITGRPLGATEAASWGSAAEVTIVAAQGDWFEFHTLAGTTCTGIITRVRITRLD